MRWQRAIFILALSGSACIAQAKTFTSSLNLKVYEYGFGIQPDTYLGFTSSKKVQTVNVPSHDYWYVQPVGNLSEPALRALAKELRKQKIPGLDLSSHWDISNKSLGILTEDGGPLKLLLLNHTNVTDKGLEDIDQWRDLKYLVLNKQTTDAGIKQLARLKQLEYLNLHRAKVTDAGIALLTNHPKLRGLDIGGTRVTDTSAKTLGSMMSLRQLDMNDTALTDYGVAALAGLTQLQTLYVSQNITDKGLQSFKVFKKLRVLDLSGAPITNAGAEVLPLIGDIEELALSGTKIDDGALKSIAKLKHLRALELSYTGVTPEGLPDLVVLKRLETLSLSWGKLTETDLRVLSELPSVKTVILNGEVVPPDVLARITKLAKINALKAKQQRIEPVGPPKPLAGVAPTAHPSAQKNAGGERLQDVKAPQRPKTPVVGSAGLPPDLIPDSSSKPSIEFASPKGKGMELEVGVGRSHSMSGLKRIHQMEITQQPKEPALEPGASNRIVSPGENATSLGEIDVNAR